MNYNINCDIGEDVDKLEQDLLLLENLSSINLACGFHAGHHRLMYKIIKKALEFNVLIGAHPGFEDHENFGRKEMFLEDDVLKSLLIYQIGACKTMVESFGGTLHHVKLHGALYNMAMVNEHLSKIIVETIKTIDSNLVIYGMTDSELMKSCQKESILYMIEGFADRRYDGHRLVSRLENGVIQEVDEVVNQGVKLLKNKHVIDIHQKIISVNCETLCVHGDHRYVKEILKGLNHELNNKVGIDED